MNSNIATLALILTVSVPIAFCSGRNNKMWHVPGRVTESHDLSRCPPCAPSETTRPSPLASTPQGNPAHVAVPPPRGHFSNGPTYPSYYQEVPPSAVSGDYYLEEDEEPMQPYPMPPPPPHRDVFVPGRGGLGGGRVGPQAGPQAGPQLGPNAGHQWGPRVGQHAGYPVGPQTGPNAVPQGGPQARPQVGQKVGPMQVGPSQANAPGMMSPEPGQAWPTGPGPARPPQGSPLTQPAQLPVGPPPRFGPMGAARHQPLGPSNQPSSRSYGGYYVSGQGYIGRPVSKPEIAPEEESPEESMTAAESEEKQQLSTITRPVHPSARIKPLFARPTLHKDRYIPIGDEPNEESNEKTKDTAKEEDEDGENKEDGKQKQTKPQKPQASNEKPEEKEEDKRLVKRGRHREEEDEKDDEKDDEKEEEEDEDEQEVDEEKDEDKKDEEKNRVEQPDFEPMVLMVQQSQPSEPQPVEPQPPEPQRPRGRMMSAEDVTRLLGQRNCLGESTSGNYFYDGYSNFV